MICAALVDKRYKMSQEAAEHIFAMENPSGDGYVNIEGFVRCVGSVSSRIKFKAGATISSAMMDSLPSLQEDKDEDDLNVASKKGLEVVLEVDNGGSPHSKDSHDITANIDKDKGSKIELQSASGNKVQSPLHAGSLTSTNISATTPAATPSSPSIMLIALVKPTTAIIVIGTENMPNSKGYGIPKI